MTPEHHSQHVDARPERARLVGLATLMLLAGAGLAAVGGPPRLPTGLPRPEQVVNLLAGSTLPVEPLALVLLDAAWLLWIWIVGSLCLELLVVAAQAVAYGAGWVRSLRRVADHLSPPLVRRAVAAAFAVEVLSRGVTVAAAQPINPGESAFVAQAHVDSTAAARALTRQEPAGPTYLVRPGDTLWSIAERAYGSGMQYRRLIDANLGRRMPDGQLFSARGVIQPGWELVAPEPEEDLEEADGQRWYTVQPGDTLSTIAARVLDDHTRWGELFDLNRGTAAPDGTHVLADANVIWPGLRLRVPTDAAAPDVPAASETAAATGEARQQPGSGTADLVAARAPDRAPSASSELAAPRRAVDASGPSDAPEAADAPPLFRTPHTLDPVVLEPSDAAVGVPEAGASANGGVSLPASAWRDELPVAPIALGGLGLTAAGVALGARRLRRLRRLPHEPESEVVVEGGFAEARLAQDFGRGLHGVGFDPIAALVGQLEKYLREYHLASAGVVSVRHGRSATSITLKASLAEQPILVDLAPVFAERLQANVEARVSADQDVVLRLVRLRRTRLLPTADSLLDSPCLVPLGVLYDRQVYSATWNSLGHTLVASLPGHGADTILTSLVATLTARRSPEQLRMWIIGSARALPAPVLDLPHLSRSLDPSDEEALIQAAEDLRAELDRRATHRPAADLVVVVPELSSLGEYAAGFELLASRAADAGVRFVAATACPEEALISPLLSHFGTRMVLRMHEEEASVALLGVADAAFLGGGGRLLLRLDGREPVELYGYQVATEHLERLVRVMRSAYPASPSSAVAETHQVQANPATRPDAVVGHDQPAEPAADRPPAEATRAQALTLSAASEAQTLLIQEPAEAVGTRVGPQPDGMRTSAGAGAGAEAGASRRTPEVHADVAPPTRPPIEVICFGGPRIRCAGQQLWPRLPGGEAKPWELLLYLACQPAEGVSSDAAVEALWPEDESAEDAPHRFRQLRYRLRRLLAEVPGAPHTDGICLDRGVLKLDPGIVASDAQAFLGLVRHARLTPGSEAIGSLEQARALYLGDLLEGPDARRYAWVDERDHSGVTLREHFRRLYQQASIRLAELYARAGQLEAAIDLYHELSELDPGDERTWRALFRLHANRGDRLALVREEHRMREALRELAAEVDDQRGLELEGPSRDTLQEYQRLLASLREREPAPV